MNLASLVSLKCAFVFVVLGSAVLANDKGNGFGEGYDWFDDLEAGLGASRSQGRPALLIIHKSWCPRCRDLKPKFASSSEILRLSRNFIMINLEDDKEPRDPKYAPDGVYYQRLLFITPNGEILTGIYNEGGIAKFRHYYTEAKDIVNSMTRVLANYP